MLQPLCRPGLLNDVALCPYHFGDPCRETDCSAGHCLPGDPVPYGCYPPEIRPRARWPRSP